MGGIGTLLCETVGIDHPIVQAPIESVSCPGLAAAVSNAGGLGMLAITCRDVDETRTVIEEAPAATDAPIVVNLVLDLNARQRPTQEHLDAVLDADVEALPMYADQSAGLATDVEPAGTIVTAVIEEARDRLDTVATQVDR